MLRRAACWALAALPLWGDEPAPPNDPASFHPLKSGQSANGHADNWTFVSSLTPCLQRRLLGVLVTFGAYTESQTDLILKKSYCLSVCVVSKSSRRS